MIEIKKLRDAPGIATAEQTAESMLDWWHFTAVSYGAYKPEVIASSLGHPKPPEDCLALGFAG